MLLSSEEPVVRQFLNAQRIGPIGMAEEKDADELEAEAASGAELPPLPPIPPQLQPSDGGRRRAERPAGQWCRDNAVVPPPGSFETDTSTNGRHAAEDTHEYPMHPSEVTS
jgi:phospholipid/cholesterol/gamma-HCH transport system ATP-binding protein